ncbi:MAG: D-alpha,beta-d-heptose 7-phosphate 1-kinase, d-beta-d-heptose 1-phosphate adenylyltransferase [Patescibacteria group bacterium]|jgi:D-beta-D-heptose 7-phosphate kinase/D-beta-D-heptose 1-phosphate adenosyltransferase|nr:D-alpha,beta-d-heptose 7-phosphate 1-kinase, d-beta-d-heptose 1-phosphate adenylyltransferase [Patescibacteria group bacterium]
MMTETGILGTGSNYEQRYIEDHDTLAETIAHIRAIGYNRIVLTQGTFDMFHMGHGLYLEKARQHGDILVVGVDSDEKVRARKGDNRPIVPEMDRIRMLTLLRCVHIVTIKPHNAPRWSLIKAIKPEILIATQATYKPDDLEKLKEFCGEVVRLEPMATTSTSAQIRKLHTGGAKLLAEKVSEKLPGLFGDVLQDIANGEKKE